MRRHIIAGLLTVATVTPAAGQTIGDTFNQLRSTLRQLGGGRAPAGRPPRGPTTASEPMAADAAADGVAMVPASVLADDPSDTSLERTPLVARRVETFDVRGFKLGMSPREAGRIAQRERFRRRWNSLFLTTGTFEAEAAALADRKLVRPIGATSKPQLGKVQAFDPDGNEINLEFTLEPVGPRLSRMTYNAKLNGTSLQQAATSMIARYGRPTGGQPGFGEMSWENGARSTDLSSPRLGVVMDGDSMMLFLNQSVDYGRTARQRLEARAAQLAAGKGGGVRF